MSTIGFAIKQNDSINVRTVSPTVQAAWINWLVVECGMLVRAHDTSEGIKAAYDHLAAERGAICVQVEIREMNP